MLKVMGYRLVWLEFGDTVCDAEREARCGREGDSGDVVFAGNLGRPGEVVVGDDCVGLV